jgi:hypothetical protein
MPRWGGGTSTPCSDDKAIHLPPFWFFAIWASEFSTSHSHTATTVPTDSTTLPRPLRSVSRPPHDTLRLPIRRCSRRQKNQRTLYDCLLQVIDCVYAGGLGSTSTKPTRSVVWRATYRSNHHHYGLILNIALASHQQKLRSS